MSNIKLEIELESTRAVLFNRFAEDDAMAQENAKIKKGKKDKGTPQEQARKCLYEQNNKIYFPFSWFSGSLKKAACDFKMQGSRKTYKDLINVATVFADERIFLEGGISPENTEVFSTSVVIPATRGRIMKHRPRLNNWTCKVRVNLDTDFITKSDFMEILKHSGERVGIGDWRPGKGGPFGTFKVLDVKEI